MNYQVYHRREPIKADTQQDVDYYAYSVKGFAFACPPLLEDLSPLLKYSYTSDIAIVLPMFVSWKGKYNPYTEALAKVSMYLLRDVLTKTDIPAENIPVYLGVDKATFDFGKPYFDTCEIPEEHIRVFNSKNYHTANKIVCVMDSFFDMFDKVVWLDIMQGVRFSESGDLLRFGEVLRDWDSTIQPLLIPRPNFRVGFRHSVDKSFEARKARFHVSEDEAAGYAKAVENLFVNGWINGFGKSLRTGYYRSKIDYLCQVTNGQNDEYVMEVIASELGTDKLFCLSDVDIEVSRSGGKLWTRSAAFQTYNNFGDFDWSGDESLLCQP